MKKIKIRIPNVQIARELVAITSASPCDVNLVNARGCVDAKSLLGVMTMDLSHEVDIEIIGEDKDEDALIEKLTALMEVRTSITHHLDSNES